MNRERRRAARAQRKTAAVLLTAKERARTADRPVRVFGFHSACADCRAGATITVNPDGTAIADIHHDEHCPAANGAVPWRVVA
jgi:hypothetical protein